MKKVFNFLRENPLFVIVALVSVVLYALDDAEAGMAARANMNIADKSPARSEVVLLFTFVIFLVLSFEISPELFLGDGYIVT